MSDYGFHPNKKKVGIYWNDGQITFWVQAKVAGKPPSEKLRLAIEAARKAFFEVYAPVKTPPSDKGTL